MGINTVMSTKPHEHTHVTDHAHEHQHGHDHDHEHDHSHGHEHEHDHSDHEHEHGSSHGHGHDHKTHFHDPAHAADFDRRGLSGIRASLTDKLIEMLTLKGEELVLDVATGTGRVARPLSKQIKGGKIVGVDQAQAMLDVGHHHEEPIPSYLQSAGEADKLPFKTNTFDRAFVSFSLHHFGNAAGVVGEVLRVLKNSGRFVVLDPIIEEAKDASRYRARSEDQSSVPPHPRRCFPLPHLEQHSAFADQSRLPRAAQQRLVLRVQPGRHGRHSHRTTLARSRAGAGKRSAGVGRAA